MLTNHYWSCSQYRKIFRSGIMNYIDRTLFEYCLKNRNLSTKPNEWVSLIFKQKIRFWVLVCLPPPSLQKRVNTSKRLIIELNLGLEFKVKLTYALCIFVVCAQYSIRSFWRLFLEILPFRISHLQSRRYSKTIIYPHCFYGSTWYLRNWTRVILIKLDSHLRNKCSTLREFYWCIDSRS